MFLTALRDCSNFHLVALERICGGRTCKVDGLLDEFRHSNLRVGASETHIASLHVFNVQQGSEIDRIKLRLERIERRLELTEG